MIPYTKQVFCTDLGTGFRLALYSIKRLVFIAVVESVYSAVRTDSLYKAGVLYGSWNGERVLLYTALRDWFL